MAALPPYIPFNLFRESVIASSPLFSNGHKVVMTPSIVVVEQEYYPIIYIPNISDARGCDEDVTRVLLCCSEFASIVKMKYDQKMGIKQTAKQKRYFG